ncbi:MAG: bacteriohemerythrin [Candidatus Paceibacterota bacterium]|jgi:hemerythrin
MQKKFIWSENYSVGVASIDEQHQHFFDIVNSILDMVDQKDVSRETLIAPIRELSEYVQYHLGTEETYFAEFHYPEAAAHINAHNQYREKIKSYLGIIDDPEKNMHDLAKEIAIFSGDWLFNHILLMDRQYTETFREHMVR